MAKELPTDCLNNYDDLDLHDHRQRRLATYCLEDFYGSILSEYGREYLNFTHGDLSDGIGLQWNKAKSRIEEMEDAEVPDRYNDVIHRLNTERNTKVAHDYQANPSLDRLEDARQVAGEWAEWFIECAESYADMQKEQTAEEMVVSQINSIITSVVSGDTSYFDPQSANSHASLVERSIDIQAELSKYSEANNTSSDIGVDKELVQILLDAVEVRNDKKELDITQQTKSKNVAREQEHAEKERVYPCVVTEKYRDLKAIYIIANEPESPILGRLIKFSEFPEKRDFLNQLSVDDKIRIKIGFNKRGEEFVQDVME